jgi:hypothetical protein
MDSTLVHTTQLTDQYSFVASTVSTGPTNLHRPVWFEWMAWGPRHTGFANCESPFST